MSLDLKKLRQDAGLTQDQLADMLDIGQSQVSRYEEEPDSMPHALWKRWVRALGLDPASAELSEEEPQTGIEPGDPLRALSERLRLFEEYCRAREPAVVQATPSEPLTGLPTITDFRKLLSQLKRKPNVVFTGKFDAGKSRMANGIIGNALLPVGWQPTSRLITYIRHVEDRPAWVTDDVCFMKRGFSSERWNDETHWKEHAMRSGNADLLSKFGVYPSRTRAAQEIDAESVVVFADAPVLKAANLIDLPGHRDSTEEADADAQRASTVFPMADVLIYAAQHAGFLGGPDFSYLGQFIRTLPAYELDDPSFPTLGNLFIVATHAAHHVKESELREGILGSASDRLWRHLVDTAIKERAKTIGRTIHPKDLEARFFGYWAERKELREKLYGALTECLGRHVPNARIRAATKRVVSFQEGAQGQLAKQLKSFKEMLQDVDRAKRQYDQLFEGEKERQAGQRKRRAEVEEQVAALAASAQTALEGSWTARVNAAAIEQAIKRQYGKTRDPKGEAKKYAAAYVLELVQHDIALSTDALGGQLSEQLERYLATYGSAAPNVLRPDLPPLEVPFDSRGAFLGGAAAAGVVGGLSLWASSLGSLGAYIIAAKATSVLAALGISFAGGTATVMSLIAAIGGPVVIAAGIFVGLGALVWSLFGDSWERRLAKRIEKDFGDQKVFEKLGSGLARFWTETLQGFQAGAEAVEHDYRARIDEYRQMLEKPTKSRAAIDLQLKYVEALWLFFSGIPVPPV